MYKLLLPFIFLACCSNNDKMIRSSYIDMDIQNYELTVTNTSVDPVFVYVILEQNQTATIPPENTMYFKQKSFTIDINTTKKFRFNNFIKVRFLRTCLIIKNNLDFCKNESY